MPPISPADGPVAVTGASGYIGSWVVRDLLGEGYRVRACVRDQTRPEKVDHLLDLADGRRGTIEIHEGDLWKRGSYDRPFADCAAVIHVAAPLGYNGENPQETYDGCFVQTEHVLEAILKAGTVQRVVYTSSFAAVTYPCPGGYVFTERDWADRDTEAYGGAWSTDNTPANRGIAYKMAKLGSERQLYEAAERDGGFEAMSILPTYVIGPVMCANHDQRESFQYWIKRMAQGDQYGKVPSGRMQWTICDVRDVARSHRLCLESVRAGNGSRYIIAPVGTDGILFTWQLQERMAALMPYLKRVGGEEMVAGKPAKPTHDGQRAFGLLAVEELGLVPRPVDDTIRETVNSYYRIGLLP